MCIQPTKALPGAHARKNVPRWVDIWQQSPLRMRLISYWNDGAGDSSLYGQNYKVVYICEWDTNPNPPITTINAELKKYQMVTLVIPSTNFYRSSFLKPLIKTVAILFPSSSLTLTRYVHVDLPSLTQFASAITLLPLQTPV